MKGVRIEQIGKDFFSLRRGRVMALNNVTLDVEAGAFFVLLGPSGCGKSTLLNIVAGLEEPTRGDVWIGERRVASADHGEFLTPRERDVAMVFQSYALYPHMSVYDNIAFPLRIAKTGKDEIRQHVEEVARALEIQPLLGAKPRELSGGQRQRVALGRAIVRRPAVLLLDEPLSNLDALLRISMRGELKRTQRELGITTIYVTHDQTEAMTLGDRIAVLKDGIVQQVDAPGQIYGDPENIFVARFVGTPPMNFLDGKILASTNTTTGAAGIPPEDLVVGLRPEHLRLTPPQEGVLRGTVTLVGSLGSETLLYVDVDGSEMVMRLPADDCPRVGDAIGINVDRAHYYYFDKPEGRRVRP